MELYLSNVLAALLLPAFVAYLTRFQIKPEERALLIKFGPSFVKYMAAVGRWLWLSPTPRQAISDVSH